MSLLCEYPDCRSKANDEVEKTVAASGMSEASGGDVASDNADDNAAGDEDDGVAGVAADDDDAAS